MTPEVGVVGLGRMGLAIARWLHAGGVRLVVHDAAPGRAGRSRAGWRVAASPAEVARACPVVLLVLPDGEVVRRTVEGRDGLAAHARRRAVVVDLGSSDPAGTRRLAARLARRRIDFVDAPVSGGVRGARTGDLVVMAGGRRAALRRVRPLLARIGRRVVEVGPPGAGHAMKALNNYVTAATLTAVWEAVLLAGRDGIAPDRAVAVLDGGSARSAATAVKFPRYVLTRRYDSGGSVGLLAKDVRTARSLVPRGAARALLPFVVALVETAGHRDAAADHCLLGVEVARRLGVPFPKSLRPRRGRRTNGKPRAVPVGTPG